jgi:YD repeat-containing protein
MDAGFNLTMVYQGAPFIWGSAQSTLPMQYVFQATPFLVISNPQGAVYTYDSLGRLTQVTYSNLTTITYNYDATGNRTRVVTTCGPDGC